ncbi:hypothetical protein [Roseateles sp.]|uniref:hypothetical protein n=1 Tax=Roseateles sp. TaxID=1971397 RepID=UPI0032656D09
MQTNSDDPERSSALAAAAKAIGDLDALLQAMQSSMGLSKPWQRQLAAKLTDAARHLDILRLTISLEREATEIANAASALLTVLRQADANIAAGRADEGTRCAVRLAAEFARRVDRSISDYCAPDA